MVTLTQFLTVLMLICTCKDNSGRFFVTFNCRSLWHTQQYTWLIFSRSVFVLVWSFGLREVTDRELPIWKHGENVLSGLLLLSDR